MAHRDHRELQRARPFSRAERLEGACAPWSMLLPEAAEGLLSETEQAAFDRHTATCAQCSAEFVEAQRGLAWLTVLKEEVPTPPDELLQMVLAKTTGMAEAGVFLPPLSSSLASDAPMPEWQSVSAWEGIRGWLRGDPDTWSTLLQPRLAMTGAMAFLSICLTLNLLGIQVTQLDGEALRGGDLSHSVSRTGTSLLHSMHGLRVAYEVESRVHRMQAEMDGSASAGTERNR